MDSINFKSKQSENLQKWGPEDQEKNIYSICNGIPKFEYQISLVPNENGNSNSYWYFIKRENK